MTKRRFFLVTASVICFFAGMNNANAQFSGGDGSANNPYIITTAAQLAQLATYVNEVNTDYNNKNYKLGNDIDLNGYTNWNPIGDGNYSNPTGNAATFQGKFNGNGYVIQNLTVNHPSDICMGFFGHTYYATIENLGVEECDIVGETFVGGLVGIVAGTTLIRNCYATGKVNGNDDVGGLVGRTNDNSVVATCYSTCSVNGTGEYVGGLVGITAHSSNVMNCYSTGNVSGNDYRVGGLVGDNESYSSISNCYTTGNVSGLDQVGGLVGANFGTISNCVAANHSVIADVNTNEINRIVGYNGGGSCKNNYALNNMVVESNGVSVTIIDGLNTTSGMGKDLSTFQTRNFYATGDNWMNGTWDITSSSSIWDIREGQSLPFLRWQNNVGIEENFSESVKIIIYPNPTNGKLFIECENIITIKLYDMLGKEVLTQPANGNTSTPFSSRTEINISHLPTGVYSVQVLSDGKVVGNSKIVKQ